MRESLAQIQTIKRLCPIPKADKIEKAEVLGWEVIVQKGQFNVGDKIVYCEIDSILPEYPCFEFLRSRKFRIRTIKMRDQVSQGIVFPLSVLSEVTPGFDASNLEVGDDVTEALKITKFDPEAELDVAEEDDEPVKPSWIARKFRYLKWKLFGFKPIKKGSFPSDVPKTDETRVQKMGSTLEYEEGREVYITEKVEGTSGTFIIRKNGNWLARLFGKGYTFQICTRNRILFNTDKQHNLPTHPLANVAIKYDIEKKMKSLGRNLAIQGECIGPKIQGNIYKIPEHDLKVFLIWDIDKQQYLNFYEMQEIIWKLGLSMVPFIGISTIVNDIKYYVELSKGKSAINTDVLREGIVIRVVEGQLSFKSINPEYLLGQELHRDKEEKEAQK
jgi:hypothetical protein